MRILRCLPLLLATCKADFDDMFKENPPALKPWVTYDPGSDSSDFDSEPKPPTLGSLPDDPEPTSFKAARTNTDMELMGGQGRSNGFFNAGEFQPTQTSGGGRRGHFGDFGFHSSIESVDDMNNNAVFVPGFDQSSVKKMEHMSEESQQMVVGIVQGFLNREKLAPGELECLKSGAGEVSGHIGLVASHAVMLMQQILGISRGSPAEANLGNANADNDDDEFGFPKSPDTSGKRERDEAKREAEQSEAQKSLGFFYKNHRRLLMNPMLAMSATELMVELGMSFDNMMKLTHQVVRKCVQGDALAAFKKASQHMKNIQLLEGRFIANGADILTEMADALKAYENKDVSKFGFLVGKAMRKIALEDETTSSLPEGKPSKMVIANVTDGFMKGFFGKGAHLEIDSREDPANPIQIDLNQCISKNLKYFERLYGSMMLVYGRQDAKGGDHAQRLSTKIQDRAQFTTGLAFAMMQMPFVLRQCHLSERQVGEIMDGVKALGGGTKWKFHTGNSEDGPPSKDKVASDMATSIEDWSNRRWNTFGGDLGQLLQEMAQKVFPQKYAIDEDGSLRKLIQEAEEGGADQAGGGSALTPVMLGVTVMLLLAALVVLKSRRSLQGWRRHWCNDKDDQLGGDDLEHGVVPVHASHPSDPASKRLLESESVE